MATTTNVTDGKFVFLSYDQLIAFDKAVIDYVDLAGNPQTWSISPLQPNSVTTQSNLQEITTVALYSAGRLISQFNPYPGPGPSWPSEPLPGPDQSNYIAWAPSTKVVIIMDDDVIGPKS